MEPADIDWSTVESKYVRDETFENIDAPKWIDLRNLDAYFSANDDAWFCRPDCDHSKIGDGFKVGNTPSPSPKGKMMRSTSEILPFGERNGNIRDNNSLKRRGGIGALLPTSSPFRSPNKPKKKFENSENQDPNLPPLATKKWKDPVKSSTEKSKRQPNEERENLLFEQENWSQNQNQPKLRSTLSARNLFSGRDVLSQISEFYSEIKKMAVNIGTRSVSQFEHEDEEELEEKKANIVENIAPVETPRKLVDGSEKKNKVMNKMNLKIDTDNQNDENKRTPNKKITRGILKEVRENPPTPQRFLSPSPLKRPPKSTPERKMLLREVMMEQSSEDQKLLAATKDENCNGASSSAYTGGSSSSMFWFLKPCTYLVD